MLSNRQKPRKNAQNHDFEGQITAKYIHLYCGTGNSNRAISNGILKPKSANAQFDGY